MHPRFYFFVELCYLQPMGLDHMTIDEGTLKVHTMNQKVQSQAHVCSMARFFEYSELNMLCLFRAQDIVNSLSCFKFPVTEAEKYLSQSPDLVCVDSCLCYPLQIIIFFP